MVQGALGATGVRRVSVGVGCSVRRTGAGTYCAASRTAFYVRKPQNPKTLRRPERGPEIPEIPEILKSVLKCPEIH